MAALPAAKSLLGGKYRLVRCLAAGGMGSVWLAKHETLGSEIAVKVMSPVLTDTATAKFRFEREAKASAQLKSPHIVKVQDYGVEGGTPFMAMELLHGEDLGERIARESRLSLAATARLSNQICKALKVAHDAGLVHRDLKPGNIFLAKEGDDEVVKLLDFGIARETRARLEEEKTSTGVIVGSPHHMSPEQAQGKRVDPRSDLWSLGVVLYRALTGRRPFEGDNVTAVLLAVVTGPFPKVTEICPDLPRDLDRFFARALDRDVERRFPDAPAMAAAFEAIATGLDPTPWLETIAAPKSSGRGRDEPTMDVVAPALHVVAAPEPTVGAITTGVTATVRSRGRRSLVLGAIGLAVVIGGVGFLAGRTDLLRGGGDAAPSMAAAGLTAAPSIAAASPSVAASAAPADAPEPHGDATNDPAPSARVRAASATVRAASATARAPFHGAHPASSAKAKGGKKPAIDPFTGLPLSP